ncbi:unnamed protein product [Blepharisma stoltei]|uniref:Uncharacterized protein n=1 Tax=Blepharisma stoltei TaxID=1481888 RepID=A0AAU9JMV5_9CILI|nr:unnamed protein product [Blepharisma stoltei]
MQKFGIVLGRENFFFFFAIGLGRKKKKQKNLIGLGRFYIYFLNNFFRPNSLKQKKKIIFLSLNLLQQKKKKFSGPKTLYQIFASGLSLFFFCDPA